MSETREVAEEVWRITTPMAGRPREVHAYLARVEPGSWLLVDGGVATESAWEVLDREVERVAGSWGAVRWHLVTHMHLDHIGLVPRVRERAPGTVVAMGWLDAQRAAHAALNPLEEAEYRRRVVRRAGAPASFAQELEGGRGGSGGEFVDPESALGSHAPVFPPESGWRAIWTPGHTAGHVALLRPSDGVVIAGDSVLPRITPTLGINRQRSDPVGDYLETLGRLASWAPALMLPGHGEPIEEPHRRIAELRDHTLRETRRVREALGAGGTVWSLVPRLYPGREMPPPVRMLALREITAHLDHLIARGEAAGEERADGVVEYRPREAVPGII